MTNQSLSEAIKDDKVEDMFLEDKLMTDEEVLFYYNNILIFNNQESEFDKWKHCITEQENVLTLKI